MNDDNNDNNNYINNYGNDANKKNKKQKRQKKNTEVYILNYLYLSYDNIIIIILKNFIGSKHEAFVQ